MQLQGEAQELLLEEILKEHFPFDFIGEVGKGVEGADCIQVVRKHRERTAAKLFLKASVPKPSNNNWIEKLKTDMRNKQADVAILVTQAYPKDMELWGKGRHLALLF